MLEGGNGARARERIVSLFWPDEESDKARRALAQALYALRRDLECDGAIVGTHELRLDATVISSDVAEFTAAIKRGELDRAVAAYGGPFLDGFHLVGAPEFDRWLDEERRALNGAFARCLDRLASAAEREGDQLRSAEYLRQLSVLDPLNAKVAVRLMRTLDALDDKAGALAHARIYETLLSQELELPPDREVVSLAAAIRGSARASAPAARASGAPGEDALSARPDLTRPSAPDDAARDRASGRPAPARALPVRYATSAVFLVLLIASAALLYWRQVQPRGIPRVTETRRVTVDDGLELDPAISPDGRLVAYAGGAEGSLRLYVRQVEGGRAVAISVNGPAGDHRHPRWSPDGTRLVFQADRAIWTVSALGGSTRVVVDAPLDSGLAAAFPAWSPDGQQLAWVSDGAVHARAIDGGASRVIARHEEVHSIAWAPDGEAIVGVAGNLAFGAGASAASGARAPGLGNVAPSALWLFPISGGASVQLTDARHLNTSPDWLGDSHHLVFVSDRGGGRDLFLLSLDRTRHPDGEPVRLTTGLDAHSVTASGNGLAIAYTSFRQTANIWSIPIADEGVSPVAGATRLTKGGQSVEAIDVSPDGQWLAFDADRNGQQDIFRISTTGGAQERLVAGNVDDFHPAWSPDGRSIALHRIIDGVRKGGIVAANGGIPRLIRPGEPSLEEVAPQWSPDGTRLLFVRDVHRQPQLFEAVRTSDTLWRAPRQLTLHGGLDGVYSPDGRQIAYFASQGELRVMTVAGGESSSRTVLSATSKSLQPISARWARDRRRLFVKAADASGNVAIYAVPLDGSPPRPLVRFDDPDRPFVRPEFANDGKRLYFTLAERTADIGSAHLTRR